MRFITDNQDDSKKEVIMKQCLFTLISILMVMTSCSNRKTPVDSNTHDFPTYNTTRESAKTDSVIKDVSNMDVSKARKTLEDLGLEVNSELTYKSSSTIPQGKVISTDPISGRTVKKGKPVTLIVSSGVKGIVLENYVGKNYFEIKEQLEALKIKINVETEDVSEDEDNKVDENTIIGQSPKSGTIINEGDSISITLPNIVTEYPDFVKERWTFEKVVEFCTKYGVTVEKATRETDAVPEGTVVAQSRNAGMRVTSPYTLVITVAIPPTIDNGDIDE